MALYVVGFVSYGATLVFYAAIFPRLARNTAHARELREKYDAGEIAREEYEREESLEKNRISNVRFSALGGAWCWVKETEAEAEGCGWRDGLPLRAVDRGAP